MYNHLGAHEFTFDTFTYCGLCKNQTLSWLHIQTILIEWINQIVLPVVYERNSRKVLSAIPVPPQYNPEKLLDNTYILESEAELSQGTCFNLKGIGIVTCQHTTGAKLKIYNRKNFNQTHTINVVKSNEDIDLAILKSESFVLNEGLEIGSADNLNLMDHIASVGFPNYRYGDTGVFSPGLVIGFRMVSGIRRILVNIPLIAGNSGGPVIDKHGKVIGVAVTGADRMENSHRTENHGVIPVDALKFLN